MRKTTYILSACLLAVVFISSRVIFYHITVPPSFELRTPSRLREIGYMTEDEALQDEPITDIKDAAFLRYSIVKLKDNKHSYKIGDTIYLSIILKNGYHNRRTKGGDLLRVRIFNTDLQASAAGYVIDHKDGSYTAVVDALWPGKHTISILLAFRREMIRALYAMQRKDKVLTNHIDGLFDNGKTKEVTMCHPRREGLPQYQKVCNLTMINGGMSWYCGKPTDTTILCEDWKSVQSAATNLNETFNDVETYFLGRQKEQRHVTVTVEGVMPGRKNLLKCSALPARQSWVQDKPTGYFYKDEWYLHHCRTEKIFYSECLRNKKLLIFGDSTTRAWFKHLMERLSCKLNTEIWWKEKWHKHSVCQVKKYNFTMEWLPHAQPFFPGRIWESYEYTKHPIATRINQLLDNDNVIVLIYMFGHVVNYHKSIFQGRMTAISNSVKSLLQRNRLAKVLIKGPHTYNIRLTNFFTDVYRDILREEFENLYDNVVFMEQADMTLAKNNADGHPGPDIIEAAVNQMFGYICE